MHKIKVNNIDVEENVTFFLDVFVSLSIFFLVNDHTTPHHLVFFFITHVFYSYIFEIVYRIIFSFAITLLSINAK